MTLEVQLTKQSRLVPTTSVISPSIFYLSPFEALTVRWPPTRAVWVFPPSHNDITQLILALKLALQILINRYPILTGEVHRDVDRYDRFYVKAGSPGITLLESFADAATTELYGETFQSQTHFDPISIGSQSLIPDYSYLASPFPANSSNLIDIPTLSSFQITTFRDNGIGLAILTTHQIADAKTIITLMKEWTEITTYILRRDLITKPLTSTSGTHDTQLIELQSNSDFPLPRLDFQSPATFWEAQATYNGTQSAVSNQRVAIATQLPMRFFDIYHHQGAELICGPLPEPFQQTQFSTLFGEPLISDLPEPQSSSDRLAIRGFNIFPVDLEILLSETRKYLNDAGSFSNQPNYNEIINSISSLDIFQAYIWVTVLLARNYHHHHQDDTQLAHYYYNLNHRDRYQQNEFGPDPSRFGLSPVSCMAIQFPLSSLFSNSISSIATVAFHLRKSLFEVTPERLQAFIHTLHFDPLPSRIWSANLGYYHYITSSWHRSGLWDISLPFNGDQPNSDVSPGLVHPCYAAGITPTEAGVCTLYEKQKFDSKKWYQNGITFILCLPESDMTKFTQYLKPSTFLPELCSNSPAK